MCNYFWNKPFSSSIIKSILLLVHNGLLDGNIFIGQEDAWFNGIAGACGIELFWRPHVVIFVKYFVVLLLYVIMRSFLVLFYTTICILIRNASNILHQVWIKYDPRWLNVDKVNRKMSVWSDWCQYQRYVLGEISKVCSIPKQVKSPLLVQKCWNV